MAIRRLVALAALLLPIFTGPLLAQDVTLTSRDGKVALSGNLLGFDGEFYRVDTEYGELTVDGTGVLCAGPGCPDLEDFVARIRLSGAPTIGRVLMPALLEAFALRNGYVLHRDNLGPTTFTYILADRATDKIMGEFLFDLSTSDDGLAALIADDADIALSLREAKKTEIAAARNAGLGDLSARGRSRVVALDGLVAVTAPGNMIEAITPAQLGQILSGKITRWNELGGPFAPIAVHVWGDNMGLGQAVHDRLLAPDNLTLAFSARKHYNGKSLIDAVMDDPFALGVTARSNLGRTWELALTGECGFALDASRRNLKTEDYPLTQPLFLYLPARRFPKLVREFLAYLDDPAAQLVIRRAGFVDQSTEEIAIDTQGARFANAILHAGTEVGLSDIQHMTRTLAPLKRLTTSFRFEAGSARLDAQSRSNIRQLAAQLEVGLYDERTLMFVGFSDGNGSAKANQRISMQRARAVRDAVTNAAEIADLSRIDIQTQAFGEALPMACDDSAWGRQVNRRVEVWVR